MIVGIGSASSYKAIVIAKFIKNNYEGIKIIGLDDNEIIDKIHSRYYDQVLINKKDTNASTYYELLLQINADLFIPVDSSVYKLIYSSSRLQSLTSLDYLGKKESFLQLNNKIKLHSLATELNIKVPKTFYNNINKIKEGTVVKPSDLTSSKGVFYVTPETVIKVKNEVRKFDSFLVQEFIRGQGVGLSLFAEKGEIISCYGHKRLAEYPVSGGSSSYRMGYSNEEMLDVAKKIVHATSWSGFVMFEFKLTPGNELYLIEANPRIWGSINQGLQNGVNFFEHLLDKSTISQKSKVVNTYQSPLIYISFLKYMLHFKFKPIILFIKNLHRNKADVNLFNDPKGFVSMILRSL